MYDAINSVQVKHDFLIDKTIKICTLQHAALCKITMYNHLHRLALMF